MRRQGNLMKKLTCRIFFLLLVFIIAEDVHAAKNEVIVLTVQKGDTLSNICWKYLERPNHWPKIAKINRLRNPHRINPGEILMIPVKMLRGIPLDGQITFIKGEVWVREAGKKEWFRPDLADTLKQGSNIRTGDPGAIEITFKDGNSFFLRANTSLEIKNARKKSSSHLVYELFLQVGRSISKVKNITGKDSRFEIHTPSAVAAARGTNFRVSVDSHESTRCEVLAGKVRVAAANKKVEVQEGEGTFVKQHSPPIPPNRLLSPPEPVHLQPLYKAMPLEFEFKGIENATSYRVMLARDTLLKDVVKEKVITPQDILQIVGVDDGTYYLQTRSIDKTGIEGLPSEPIPVKVRVNPLPPFIQSPADGAELREKTVRVQWLKVEDAVQYHLQVAEDPKFTVIIKDLKDLKTLGHTIRSLDYKTYYFRISSTARDGYMGIWSDTLNFTIIPPPPAPSISDPEVTEETIQIRWRNLGADISYHFQLARDVNFTEILMDTTVQEPEITIQKSEESGTYYVRTSGIDSEGYEGDFSRPQSFEIKGTPYAAVLFILLLGLAVVL